MSRFIEYTDDDREQISRYVTSYIKKTERDDGKKTSTIREFADFLKTPTKMKKISHLESPVEIQREATKLCNHHCYFCYFSTKMDSKDDILTSEEAKKIVDEASELNVVELTIEGGEPFMRADLLDILDYIKKSSDISIDILTNGSLITEKLASRLANILDPKYDRFQVSLVGHNEESHRNAVGRNTFNNVNDGIKSLVEKGFPVRSNTVVTTYNFDHLHEIYELANNEMINDGFTIAAPLHFDDPLYSDGSKIMKAVRSINEALEKEEESEGVKIKAIPPFYYIPGIRAIANEILANKFGYVNRTGCEGAGSKMNINFNGDVFPCVFLQYDEFKMGNVKRDSLRDIWSDPENDLYVFREGRKASPHKCGECEISPYCSGGCFGSTYYKAGSFVGPILDVNGGDNLDTNSFNFFVALINKTVIEKSHERLQPVSASFEVTSSCNLRCIHCYNTRMGGKTPGQISTSKVKAIIEDIRELQLLQLTLTGGEPFARRDIFDIIGHIKDRTRLALTVHTNGTLINREKAHTLGSILSPQDIVQVSVEGIESINDSIRGKGSWKKSHDTINLLLEYGVKVRVNLTPTRMNINNVSQLAETLEGVNEFGATPMALFKNDDRRYIPDPKTAYEVEKIVKPILKDKGIKYSGGIAGAFCQYVNIAEGDGGMDSFVKSVEDKHIDIQCNAAISKFHISSDGKVFPCVFMQSEEFLMGDLNKEDLFSIWNRWDITKTKRHLDDVVCGLCIYKNICKGGCPGMSNSLYGTIDRQDPRCSMNAR